jgi:hypothetical protein
LTGFYPPYHGVRVNGNNALRDELTTLAEVFSASGYQTAVLLPLLFWMAAGDSSRVSIIMTTSLI